jgi:xanthine dehydrogenase small subunit
VNEPEVPPSTVGVSLTNGVPLTNGVSLSVNGTPVVVSDRQSLLDALRDELTLHSVKDGCSPQGQCGCCTVWVDGQPRVACVTPVARVRGRDVTTLEGLANADDWARRFTATGASQCGFCTPGIIMRLAALDAPTDAHTVRQALLAHMCRCTGWQPIVEAAIHGNDHDHSADDNVDDHVDSDHDSDHDHGNHRDEETDFVSDVSRSPDTIRQRATLEGRAAQRVDTATTCGRAGFACDTAPAATRVAVRNERGDWVAGATMSQARAAAARVQGRRTTAPLSWPVQLPDGEWALTLQTTWVEPAYLELDAAWHDPTTGKSSGLANGGAFGGKAELLSAATEAGALPADTAADFSAARLLDVGQCARELADGIGSPVMAMLSREDVVRLRPKRPPMAIALRPDGSGIVRVASTPGIAASIHAVAPDVTVDEVEVVGPPTSATLRAAGWAEVAVARAVLRHHANTRTDDDTGSGDAGSGGRSEDRSNDGDKHRLHEPTLVTIISPDGSRATAHFVVPPTTISTTISTTDVDAADDSAGGVSAGRATGTVGETRTSAHPSLADCELHISVTAGPALDEITLRSACIGAAHMALGWVTNEAIAVDDQGVPLDLTIRSFGILRAVDMPAIHVTIVDDEAAESTEPVNGSDAVFAAVAAATWLRSASVAGGQLPTRWPTMRA